MRKQFQIIVITSEDFQQQEISSIKKLFAAGLKTLHLRKPDASEEELRELLKSIPKKFRKRIVIHNHYALIKEFKLKGAHLPESARRSRQQQKIKVISTSFHSIKKLKLSRRKYEYVFLSPIFDSLS